MSETKPELERIYTVPLARAWITPRHQRTKRVVNMLREYAEKHMKSSEIKIETSLNEELWKRGITSPPRRITVKMSRDEDGVVTISLPKEKKEAEKETEPASTNDNQPKTEGAAEQPTESKPAVAQSQTATPQQPTPVKATPKKKSSK